jgi:hypothetical protein
MPGDVTCDASMYADWDEITWGFGTSSDYPVLVGDEDSDGVRNDLDVDDDNNGLIEIATLQELDLMRYDSAGTSLNGDSTGCPATGCNGYELVADLDFDTNGNGVADAGDLFWNGGEGWEPIPLLINAEFNGNGYTLSNLNINRVGENIGLFSVVENSIITSINFDNVSINALNDGFVEGVGTLVGYLKNSSVYDTTAHSVNVVYENRVDRTGLLIGQIYGNSADDIELQGIETSGSILPEGLQWGNEMGGVVGYARAQSTNGIVLQNISSVSEVRGGNDIGGVIGYAYNVSATNLNADTICNAYHQDCGGVIGQAYLTQISWATVTGNIGGGNISGNAGGIVGRLDNGSIQSTSFDGDVYMNNDSGGTGGLLGSGQGVDITDSYARGNVTGMNRVGGLIGMLYMGQGYAPSLIERTYSVSLVSGSIAEGGLIGTSINYYSEVTAGDIAATVISSYWDTEVSGLVISVGGEGKTTFDLQCSTMPGDVTCDASMYADWDEITWDFGTSSDYPVLR